MGTVFEAVGGSAGVRRLADAWHRRVVADEVVGHAFSPGFRTDHVDRLAAYWVESLGGPAGYTGVYGDESSVVRRHSGNGEIHEMNERAMACFDLALVDAGLDADERLRTTLHEWFGWATENTMNRYPRSADDVPAGLTLTRWTWDGPATAEITGR